MCGIFAYFGDKPSQEIKQHFLAIQHRGPDSTNFQEITPQLRFGFHRLAINGLDKISDQPMRLGKNILICNGEIYNFKKLRDTYGFDYKSNSDCEIILHLYKHYGFPNFLSLLDGVFTIILYDGELDEVFIARDRYGVRQLFLSTDPDDPETFGIASEAKALLFHPIIDQVKPGTWARSKERIFKPWFELKFPKMVGMSEATILATIRDKFRAGVKKRTMSDRRIGALLSGGVDSSLIAGMLVKFYNDPRDLETFSIGLEGSPDLYYAKKVADFLGTTHHSVVSTEKEFLAAIEPVIYMLGTFDVTTIRASVGQWLLCQYIKRHSDVKVIFSGEYADEQNLSYLYGMNAPSAEEFQEESLRLLEYIGYFDNLRADHSISNAGLEARVPFADKDFMYYMMSLDPKLKMFDNNGKMEKYLLRKAFDEENLIPKEVLWRRKNGFSDSVSIKTRSWSVIIQEYVDTQVTDEEYMMNKDKYKHCPPRTKEAYYFRKIYAKYYPSEQYHLTPFQWLPKWCGDVVDPSARNLNIYQAD